METRYLISENSLFELNDYLKSSNYSSIFVLVDEITEKLCYHIFKKKVGNIAHDFKISLKSGEDYKTIESCFAIWKYLIDNNADRNSLLINLGGGTICDIGGFVSSVFKRGIDYINVPTTLLAMVDASIGGKTGINFFDYKNQIGTFKNPVIVAIDKIFLETLDEIQLKSGYGEIIKYALISGNSLWNEIRELKSINNLMPDRIINQCIEIKDYYVKQDLNELNIRKVLNFGHTIGHAMETFFSSSNRNLFHGEAVAIGIIIESIISNNILGFPEEDLVTIIKYIHRIFPKLSFSDTDIEALLDIMLKDKKNFSGSINFTLIKGIGNAKIDNYIDKDEIRLALSEYSKI